MKLYEGLFLLDANLASRDWPGLEKHVEDLLKKHSAELVYSERWPDHKLAYEIKGCRKGTYFLTYFHAPAGAITPLQRDIQLSERILRALILQNEYVEEMMEDRRRRDDAAAGAMDGAERERAGVEVEPGASAGDALDEEFADEASSRPRPGDGRRGRGGEPEEEVAPAR